MSVKVDLDQLAEALADFTFAYLVTVDDGHRAHAVAVDPVLADGVIDVGTVGAQHPPQPGSSTTASCSSGRRVSAAATR